jgi:uncharacterized GH25 family protein
MRRAVAAVAMFVAAAAAPAGAHEFWFEPERFSVAPGEASPARLMVGIGRDREPWNVGPQRVSRLTVHGPGGMRDVRGGLREPGSSAGAVVRYPAPGLHVVAFESLNDLSVLPAERFHAYLADEGLQTAIAFRTARGQAARPGRELYSRRAKALVQAGAPSAADDQRATSAVGLTLEIVPERNPYRLEPGAPLPVRVLYRGRPLEGALVKLFCLDVGHTPLAQLRTDRSGRAAFTTPREGDWLLSVVWTRPVAARTADFETVFSSLTFGYRARKGA